MSIIFLPPIVHPFGIHQPIYPPSTCPSCYPAANQPSSIYTPNNDTPMLHSFVAPCIHSWIHPSFFCPISRPATQQASIHRSIHIPIVSSFTQQLGNFHPSIHPSIIHSPVRSPIQTIGHPSMHHWLSSLPSIHRYIYYPVIVHPSSHVSIKPSILRYIHFHPSTIHLPSNHLYTHPPMQLLLSISKGCVCFLCFLQRPRATCLSSFSLWNGSTQIALLNA